MFFMGTGCRSESLIGTTDFLAQTISNTLIMKGLDPRRLMIFRSVARAGSISAAARQLGWTQPAVSQHLNRLERAVGCPLLLRGSQGVTLTEAGHILLRRADSIAGELHMGAEELASLVDARTGRVRLVAFPSAAATVVPRALAALARNHPGIEVGLTEAEPPEARAMVRHGEADLAIAFTHQGPPHPESPLSWLPLLDEPVHLVVPSDHAVLRRTVVRLRDFANESWIGGCVRCREHLVARCMEAGFEPVIRHTTDNYVVVQNLVAHGLGVTLLPQSALDAFRHRGVSVRAAPEFGQRQVGVAHLNGARDVPANAALIAELIASVAASR
jgi:molybdate transport repressor ModE-like protein